MKIPYIFLGVIAVAAVFGFSADYTEAATITKAFNNQSRIVTVFDFGTQVPLPRILVTFNWCWRDSGISSCFSDTRDVAVGQTGLVFSAFKADGGAGTAGPTCAFYTENQNAFDYCMSIISSTWDGRQLILEWEGLTDRFLNDQFGNVPLTTIRVTTDGVSSPTQYYYLGSSNFFSYPYYGNTNYGSSPLGTINPPYQVVFPIVGTSQVSAVVGSVFANPQILGASIINQQFQTQTVTSPSASRAIIQFSKLVRNAITKEQFFANSTEAQGVDILEFQIKVRNIGTEQAQLVKIKDFIPPDLFYTNGSTRVNGSQVSEEIVDGIIFGSLNPGEEKTITFQAVVFFGVQPKTIVNQVVVSVDSASQTGIATVVIKNRGKVLGAGTVVTGPEDILLFSFILGLLGAISSYFLLFKYRFKGKKFSFIASDLRFQSEIAKLRKRESRPDII